MAWYSSLGKVKLSRTSLGFLSFCTSTTIAFDSGFAIVFAFVAALLAGFEATFDVALTPGLAVEGVFLAAVLVAAFWVGRRTRFLAAGAAVALLVAGATVSEVFVCVVSVDMFKKSGS